MDRLIFTSALLTSAIAGGTAATYLYEDDSPLEWRVCAGACTGLTALGLVGLLFSAVLTLGPAAVFFAGLAVASVSLLWLKPSHRAALSREVAVWVRKTSALTNLSLANAGKIACLAILGAAVWQINQRVVFEQADGLYTGIRNNIGDLPFHIAAITRFLYGGNLPPENPIYAGAKFTYPFLADFIVAMFATAGTGLRGALLISNIALFSAIVVLTYQWVLGLTSNRGAALLAPALLLLNGGFGWWMLVQEGQPLMHDYTIMPQGDWRWGNVVTSMLLTQRGFLLGLPLAIIVFTLWKRSCERIDVGSDGKESAANRRMLGAGVIAGMLPLAHLHTFAVVMAIAACYVVASRKISRGWVQFFLAAFTLGVPQVLWLLHGSSVDAASFVGWQPGWDHGHENIAWFWVKNTGVLIPLLAIACVWRGRNAPVPASLLRQYVPFAVLCFLIPNLLRLSPWIWDNNKILIYWHVASVPLVALVIVHLWRSTRVLRMVSMTLVILATAAGALDVWRVMSEASTHRVFTRDGMAFADLLRRTIPADALVLQAPTYNHPVFLAGRRSLIGYPGHLWSQGLSYESRLADVKRIYAGSPDADRLIAHYRIAFIVLGPLERQELRVNESFFKRFTSVATVGAYTVVSVGSSSE